MALHYEQESYAILGACFEVYKQMGPGYIEHVYHECLKIEFDLHGVPYVSKPKTGAGLQRPTT
jgi:GxxExxY protein